MVSWHGEPPTHATLPALAGGGVRHAFTTRHQGSFDAVSAPGGPFGVGKRMQIRYTRAMINAALAGQLDSVGYQRDPVFNLDIPTSCPDVPPDVLQPRTTWASAADYDAQAQKLARMFRDNFQAFQAGVSADVVAAGPRG